MGDHSTALSGWEVGVESNLLPGVQFQKLRVQLGLYAFVRIASESKAEGRFVRLDRLDDGLGGADRIARLISMFLAILLPTQAGGACVIGDRLSGLVQGATGKIRRKPLGSTTITRIPSGLSSLRRASDIPSTANLLAE